MQIRTRVIYSELGIKKRYLSDWSYGKLKRTIPIWRERDFEREREREINPRKDKESGAAKDEVVFGGWRFLVYIKRKKAPKMVNSRLHHFVLLIAMQHKISILWRDIPFVLSCRQLDFLKFKFEFSFGLNLGNYLAQNNIFLGWNLVQ